MPLSSTGRQNFFPVPFEIEPFAVVPENVDSTVFRHELANLLVSLLAHLRRVPSHRLVFEVARKTPIHQRVVETDFQTRLAACLDVLSHEVPLGAGSGCREI